MKFLVDECVARPLVDALRDRFEDVIYIVDAAPGATDTEVLEWAAKERRTLVTEDCDFGELAFRSRLTAEAIVIVAPGVIGRSLQEDSYKAAARIAKLGNELPGRLTILEAKRTRQRPLRTSG